MEDFIADDLDLRLLDALQQDASRSNQDLALALQISPATCLRRIRRLREAGLIERQMAVLSADRLAATLGHGLTAVVELSLDRQGDEQARAFEARAVADSAVQQCYRVSPGPDFVLVLQVRDMAAYRAFAHRVLASESNVRNVRTYFSVLRAKFETRVAV